MSSASRSIRADSRSLLAAVPGHLARLGRPRRLLPLPQRRQQRPVDEQVGIAADRRGEVAVGGAAEAGVAAVAVAVGGLHQGTEHERCIRLAAVPAPRRLARSPAGSPRAATSPAWLGARPWPQRRGRHAERVQLLDQALDPRRDRAGRGRGRPPAPACARAAAPPARWRGSSAARSGGATRSARRRGRRPRCRSSRSGTRARRTRRRGWSRRAARPAPRPPRGRSPAARRRLRARSPGRRRSRSSSS